MSSVREVVLDAVRGVGFVAGVRLVPLVLFDDLRTVLAVAGPGPVP